MDVIGLILTAVIGVALVVCLSHFLARRISTRIAEHAAQQSSSDRPPLIRPGFILLLLIFLATYWVWSLLPPNWVQQRAFRRAVLQRVEDSGGWERLTANAKLLAATNNSGLPIWFWIGQTNVVLPESITRLRPLSIEVNPHMTTNTVLLQFFQTGRARRRTSYSLWVAPGMDREVAQTLYWTNSRQPHRIRQLAPGVFEFN